MLHSKQDVDHHVYEIFRNLKSENERNLKCYQIAKLYYKVKDYNSAIKYINRYILVSSNSAAAFRLLGDCYFALNLKDKAFNSYKNSLELNGNQHDLILKICSLIMESGCCTGVSKPDYWLHRAESIFPKSPVVFQLKEYLIKSQSSGIEPTGQLDKLIASEIKVRPTDVNVRIRLLNFYLETNRCKLAYTNALELEEKQLFSNNCRWYECLCNVVQAYEKENKDLDFIFFVKKLYFLERRVDLFMEEFQDEVKTVSDCCSALFTFDQSLHSFSKITVPNEDTNFFKECIKHLRIQLSFHLATLVLKKAKKEYGLWPKAQRTASPLLLQASQCSMDLNNAWYNMWQGKKVLDKEVKMWSNCAASRVSQAGHILQSWSQNNEAKFLKKVFQNCGGKWQNLVFQDIFYSKEQSQAAETSHFVNDPFFSFIPSQILTKTELKQFDDVSQLTYTHSLHHIVWLGLSYCDTNGQLSHDFRCKTFPNLQFTVENLSQTGPESLNQLDVDAFVYASVLCGKAATENEVRNDRPDKLPVSISEELCTSSQTEWWQAVYQSYKNELSQNVSQARLKLMKGIETIRVIEQHGLDVKLIVKLAKLFQERAAGSKNTSEITALEGRAYLYWSAAIPLLERLEKGQKLRVFPNRLFDYKGEELTTNEIKTYLEDGRLFLGCRLMKLGRTEEAIDVFQQLKGPYPAFYQGLIYEKLASEEINHLPESITSENRSQHIIFLTRARDAFYLTLDRLRSPGVDFNHPLNSQLQDHLETVEKQLAVIDSDNSLNRNGDTESDETDIVPHRISPDVDDNMETMINIYNASNLLGIKSHGTPRTSKQNFSEKNSTRFEARPSPERLDAQLRHLVMANNSGLHAVSEQLKEIKSIIQIELKDLGCITRDLLAEMKKWSDKIDNTVKKVIDAVKPDDILNFAEEDYENLNQINLPYDSQYQSYLLNRQMTGTQGTSTVTYGNSLSSPISSVITGNQMIPSPFYTGQQAVSQLDPALLYQSLGYYQGLYNDPLNSPDLRNSGVRKDLRKKKGVLLPKNGNREAVPNISTGTVTLTSTTNSFSTTNQPPNVVITSSDTLPAFTTAGTPSLSVIIPPQHIRCTVPSSVQSTNHNQVHPFQIQMPPQVQLVKESPTEKLNSIAPSTQVLNSFGNLSTGQISNTSASLKPPIQNTLLGENILSGTTPETVKNTEKILQEPKTKPEKKKNDTKLYGGKVELFSFENNEWKKQGNAVIEIILDEESKTGKFTVLQDNSNVPYVYYLNPNTAVKCVKFSKDACVWSLKNLQNSNSETNKSASIDTIQKFYFKLNNIVGEDENFEMAFSKAFKQLNFKKENIIGKSKAINIVKETNKSASKEKSENLNGNQINNSNLKTNFGGFTFNSSPIIQPPSLKLNASNEKPKEESKISPFAAFSFPTSTTKITTTTITSTTTNTNTVPSLKSIMSENSSNKNVGSNNVNLFSSVKADPNSFKKNENFEGFPGKDVLVFGYLNKSASKESSKTNSNQKENDKEGDDDFVPTAEFTPAVELPDLVDVKTGEENDEVLFEHRAKLLRFDTDLKEWKERGIGNIKVLLNQETGKVRLIMRRELVFKVCCNHYLDESMEFKPLQKNPNVLSWYAQDYSDGDLKPECFALKLKTQELMEKFHAVIKNTQGKMKNGRVEGMGSEQPQKEKPKELVPLSELFKPKPGSWICSSCAVENKENAMTCVCCSTPKPGTKTESTGSASQTKTLGKGIVFPPTTMTFTFGIPQSTPNTVNNTSLSVSNTSSNPTFSMPATKFSFGGMNPVSTLGGTLPNTSTISVTKSSFGSATTTTVSSVFGTTTTTNSSVFGNATATASNVFGGAAVTTSNIIFGAGTTTASNAFGSTTATTANVFGGASVTTASVFGGSSSTKNSNFGSNFSSTFGGANNTFSTTSNIFGNNVSNSSTSNANVTNTGIFSMAPSSSNLSNSNTPQPNSNNFSTNNASNIFGGTSLNKPNFVFGTPKTDSEKTPQFSFGSNLKLQEKDKFSFSMVVRDDSNKNQSLSPHQDKLSDSYEKSESSPEKTEANGSDQTQAISEKVKLPTGEEDEELMYEQRSKLFRFYKDEEKGIKEWRERGIGDVKILKHKETNKIRLLMRREVVLKVCLNHYITPDIEFIKKDEKTWQWTAPDFSDGEVQYDMFAIRFKTPEIASGFMKALDDIKNNVAISPIKVDGKAEAMKNFSFTTPNNQSSDNTKQSEKGTPVFKKSDDDITVVFQNQVTAEQREKAASLHLPPNFYSYLQARDCPGCVGCETEDEPNSCSQKKTSFPSVKKTEFGFGNVFGNESQNTIKFGLNNSKPNFNFSENNPSSTTTLLSIKEKIKKDIAAHKSETKSEELDGNKEDNDDEDDNDDDEDDDDKDDDDEDDDYDGEYENISDYEKGDRDEEEDITKDDDDDDDDDNDDVDDDDDDDDNDDDDDDDDDDDADDDNDEVYNAEAEDDNDADIQQE